MSNLLTVIRNGNPVAIVPEHMLMTLLGQAVACLDGLDSDELESMNLSHSEATRTREAGVSMIQSIQDSHYTSGPQTRWGG